MRKRRKQEEPDLEDCLSGNPFFFVRTHELEDSPLNTTYSEKTPVRHHHEVTLLF